MAAAVISYYIIMDQRETQTEKLDICLCTCYVVPFALEFWHQLQLLAVHFGQGTSTCNYTVYEDTIQVHCLENMLLYKCKDVNNNQRTKNFILLEQRQYRDNLASVNAKTFTPFAISSLEENSSGLWLYPAKSNWQMQILFILVPQFAIIL